MVEKDFIESIPILNSNGSGGGDHITKLSATPTTHVIRRIRGRWQPKFKLVSGLMPVYWLPLLLLMVTLTIVLVSTCLVMNNLNQPSNVDAAAPAASDEQVFFHYIFNDVNNLSISEFSEYISYMANTYYNLKFKIFFLKDDIHTSYRMQFFSDMWTFMGLKDGIVDITLENMKAIQELQNNHSNVKIFIKRLGNYAPDKCWKYKLRQIQPMNVPFVLRMYSVWRYGGIAMDLPTYNHRHWLRLNDQTSDRENIILTDFNNKAAGIQAIGQVLKFDTSFFDFLSKYFIEFARTSYMPLRITDANNKPDKQVKATVTENVKVFNDDDGIEKRSVETTTNYKIALKNKIAVEHKMNTLENHEDLNSNATTKSMQEFEKNKTLTKEQNFASTNSNQSKIILALFRSNSYIVSPPIYEDDQMSTDQVRDDIYIDLSGKFVAADRPHHPFIANVIKVSADMTPVKAITSVLTTKCGGKFKCPYCKTVFYF